MTTIIGIDPSLTATGLAIWSDGRVVVETVRTKPDWRDEARWERVCGHVWTHVDPDPGRSLVVIEARVPSARGANSSLDRAELRGVLRYGLYRRRVPYAQVAPGTLKLFATGNGGAGKDAMLLAAERRLGHLATVADNDQADALWLLEMALRHHGRPSCELPARQAAAAHTPTWPAFDLPATLDTLLREAG